MGMVLYDNKKHNLLKLDGVEFEAVMRNKLIHGAIAVELDAEGFRHLLLCQNYSSGYRASNKHGYRYSWSTNLLVPRLGGHALTEFKINIRVGHKLYKQILKL